MPFLWSSTSETIIMFDAKYFFFCLQVDPFIVYGDETRLEVTIKIKKLKDRRLKLEINMDSI